ncbi:hypothetical protein N2152v2_010892 [Parachlorella kessleri]
MVAGSPAKFIQDNALQFTIVNALIERAGLEDDFLDGSKKYTFFLPVDHAFGWFKEYLPTLERTKPGDIIRAVQSAEIDAVRQFLQQHISTQPIPSVQALLDTEEYPSAANVALMASGDPAYLSVMEAGGYSATVAGPVVISAGESFIYVLADGLLGDPALIAGHGPLESEGDGEDDFDVVFGEQETPLPAGGSSVEGKDSRAAGASGSGAGNALQKGGEGDERQEL